MKTNTNCGYQFTLVGSSGSGKTTLAVGLTATSNPDFTVGPGNEETRKYIEIRKANLEIGEWPAPTIEADNFAIKLNLNTLGHSPTELVFKEYMGERINDPAFLDHIVGTPDAALILLNPGMSILRDAKERNEMIGNVRMIIDHLKKNQCSAIAFVVTASDRLKTDLKDFAPEFAQYAAEITHYLTTSGVKWKQFNITISGELESQDKPSIGVDGANTSRMPFLWLLNQVGKTRRLSDFKTRLRLTLAVAGLALIAGSIWAGCQFNSERGDIKDAQKSVIEYCKRMEESPKSEAELKDNTDFLHQEIQKWTNRTCIIPLNEKKRQEFLSQFQNNYDEWRIKYLQICLTNLIESAEKKGTPENCDSLTKNVSDFKPLNKDITDIKDIFQKEWESQQPKIREKYDAQNGRKLEEALAKLKRDKGNLDLITSINEFSDKVKEWNPSFPSTVEMKANCLIEADQLRDDTYLCLDTEKEDALSRQISKFVEDVASLSTVEDLNKLKNEIAGWSPYTESGKAKQTSLAAQIESEGPVWRMDIANRDLSTDSDALCEQFQNLEPSFSDGEPLQNLLKKYRTFEDSHKEASPAARSAVMEKISAEKTKTLDLYLVSFATWKPEGKERPAIRDVDKTLIHETLDSVISETEVTEFLGTLESMRSDAETKWEAKQEAICLEFIAKTFTKGRDAKACYDDYGNFYESNAKNPSINVVISKMEQRLELKFNGYVSNYTNEFCGENSVWASSDALARMGHAQENVNTLKTLCLAVANPQLERGLKDSWVFRFAKLYIDKGGIKGGLALAFPQTFTITRIEGKISYKDFPFNYKSTAFEVSVCTEKWKGQELEAKKTADIIQLKDGRKYTTDIPESKNKQWMQLWSGKCPIELNPWTKSSIWFKVVDRNNFSENISTSTNLLFRILDGKVSGNFIAGSDANGPYLEAELPLDLNRKTGDKSPTAAIRIYGTIEGSDLLSLYREAGGK